MSASSLKEVSRILVLVSFLTYTKLPRISCKHQISSREALKTQTFLTILWSFFTYTQIHYTEHILRSMSFDTTFATQRKIYPIIFLKTTPSANHTPAFPTRAGISLLTCIDFLPKFVLCVRCCVPLAGYCARCLRGSSEYHN